MNDIPAIMAKLAATRQAVTNALEENISDRFRKGDVSVSKIFPPDLVQHYFIQTSTQVETLRGLLPALYGDFQTIVVTPTVAMMAPIPPHYSRAQMERLARDIEQLLEIRANSELRQPTPEASNRVFLSHGRSNDWRQVQPFIEKDCGLATLELAQEPSLGRTVIEKLEDNAALCDGAVIVMTGDDIVSGTEARVRENVMHEIGFFQGKFGRTSVVLMHEDGASIPTNLGGVVYIPFPKGSIASGFHVLQRELKAIYRISRDRAGA
jgi:predicted nucleotide-binding protein